MWKSIAGDDISKGCLNNVTRKLFINSFRLNRYRLETQLKKNSFLLTFSSEYLDKS